MIIKKNTEKAKKLLYNNLKWGPFHNSQNGAFQAASNKINPQDWKLDLTVPTAIFAFIVVIGTIFVGQPLIPKKFFPSQSV